MLCTYAFTEHGAIMLALVLNTPRAIEVSIFVVQAIDGPLFLRYGYFMPRTSMIRYADIQKRIFRFFS